MAERTSSPQIIEAYGGGRFRVSGTVHSGSIIITPEETVTWDAGPIADATLADFDAVTSADTPIEILLLGCGSAIVPVAPPLRAALREAGIVVDAMDTGAACRTYNVLNAEGRRVAAALIAVE
jgi:uncharacterized protein